MNKRFKRLLNRMRSDFQGFGIPFHFMLFHLDVTAYCGRPSTHGARNQSSNENRTRQLRDVNWYTLKIFLPQAANGNVAYFCHVTNWAGFSGMQRSQSQSEPIKGSVIGERNNRSLVGNNG